MSSALVKRSKRGTRPERLNAQQNVFVAELCADREFCASRAAERAGYRHKHQAAARLLNNPLVAKAIGKALQERVQRCEITADRVLEELAHIAFQNRGNIVSECGEPLPLHELPEGLARCISSIDMRSVTHDDGTVTTHAKVRFESKMDALNLLMRHMGMLQGEKIQVTHDVDEDLLSKLLTRLEGNNNVVDTQFIEDRSKE